MTNSNFRNKVHKYKSYDQKSNPLKYISQSENRTHERNFDILYEAFQPVAIKSNQKYEADRGHKLYNYNDLFDYTTLDYDRTRELKIRWIKFPTFTNIDKNRPMYNAIFFCNIDYYRLGDLKQIYQRCLQIINRENLEFNPKNKKYTVTIALSGKQIGQTTYGQWRWNERKYNIFRVNTITRKGNKRSTHDVRSNFCKALYKLYEGKTQGIKKAIRKNFYYYNGKKTYHKLYGILLKDFKRLTDLSKEFFKAYRNWRKRHILSLREKKKNSINRNLSSTNHDKAVRQFQKLVDWMDNYEKNDNVKKKKASPG